MNNYNENEKMIIQNNDYQEIYCFNEEIDESLIVGPNDLFIKLLEEKLECRIIIRGHKVLSMAKKEEQLNRLKIIFSVMERLVENKIEISEKELYSIINNVDENNYKSIVNLFTKKDIIYTTSSGRSIYPRTLNQKIYIKSLEDNDIVFALGPAGTGKTYLAVLYALKCLKKNQARKIILVRPIVEAGEKLGFLPGDLKEKVDPYLIPIYDGLYDTLGKETVEKMIEKGTIEVAPLAYMRGRTLENSIIILDEAQNTTLSQMKMFLTRLGFNSKMIITGDITQIDLPRHTQSGLVEATSLLEDIEGIKILKFQKDDVMRHPLVFKIIERYEGREKDDN